MQMTQKDTADCPTCTCTLPDSVKMENWSVLLQKESRMCTRSVPEKDPLSHGLGL